MKIDDLMRMKFQSPQHKAIVNLRITSNEIGSQQTKFMSGFGISMAQFNILRILRGAQEHLTVNTIKTRMIEKSPNTTRLLDKLLEKQLISKMPCESDRRQTYIGITEHGLDLLAQIDQSGRKFMLSPEELSDEDANQLSDLLDKLRNSYLKSSL